MEKLYEWLNIRYVIKLIKIFICGFVRFSFLLIFFVIGCFITSVVAEPMSDFFEFFTIIIFIVGYVGGVVAIVKELWWRQNM